MDKLAAVLHENLELALLFRDLATLRTEAPIPAATADLRWAGPRPEFALISEQLGAPALLERAERVVSRR